MKKIVYLLAGLGGISLIILIHELGHFLVANYFGVPTPIFSIGFGPALFTFPIGQTTFQISLLPFGGYVQMNEEIFAKLAYAPKMFIIFAGVLVNLIFAYTILLYYALKQRTSLKKVMFNTITSEQKEKLHTESSLMGPIGIIDLIGNSLAINPHIFWFILAILSLNVGLFNILPLPFFDGGKALLITIETITGTTINPTVLWIISTIALTLFILFISRVTVNDIKQLLKK